MTDALVPIRNRRFLAEWLLLLGLMLGLGGYVGHAQYQEMTRLEAEQRERLASQVSLIEKNLVSQLGAANRALAGIVSDLPSWLGQPPAQDRIRLRLQTITGTLTGVAALLVIDAQGQVLASSLPATQGADAYQRTFAEIERRARDPATLYVTAPVRHADGRTSIALAREIPALRGQFGGVVMAALDPQFFGVLLDSVRYAPDVWTYLTHGDGRLFMMSPERPDLFGKDLGVAQSLFTRHRLSGQPVNVYSGPVYATGEDRMMALHTVQPDTLRMDKPLVVAISRDSQAIFAPQRRAAGMAAGAFGALVLVTVVSLLLYQRRERAMLRLRAQRASEARQLAIFNASPDIQLISDAQGLITQANDRVEHLLGYTADELIGRPIECLVPQGARRQHPQLRAQFGAAPSARPMRQGLAVKALRKDGQECDVEVSLSRIETPQGFLFVSVLRDVTERKRAEAELRVAATAFEAQEGMVVTDGERMVLRSNLAFSKITGYGADEVVGRKMGFLKSGRHDADFYAGMWAAIERDGTWQGEIWNRHKHGEVRPHWLTISAVKDGEGRVTHYVGTYMDITERKQAEAKIADLAFFDQLTGLPNRTLLLDRLRQAVTASGRGGKYGALLLIDLDQFKTLNDTLGHDVGDSLLKQAAGRLLQCVRDGDTVARLGGDEFVVLLTSLSTSEVDAASNTKAVARKILNALGQHYQLGTVVHHSTASIGATLFLGQAASADDLMKQVDLALYRTKAAGRNSVRFFDPEMETVVLRRVALERDLDEAIAARQFLLHYQAQVTGEDRLTGTEVLLRWKHPQRGMVSPAEFIPLAEETGLILRLGHWVLETACRQLVQWAGQAHLSHLTVAVNVSVHQFRQADFVDQVLAVLADTGANPQRLKLELTESLLVDNVEEIIEKMAALKAWGIGFALDDFGTGYSSLSYLKRLPLDQLKIDQSFVRDVLMDPNDAAIARTIVALANSLGLGVIAEGVETVAQRDFLARHGCHAYQGYLYSRPLPLAEFEALAQRVGSALPHESAFKSLT